MFCARRLTINYIIFTKSLASGKMKNMFSLKTMPIWSYFRLYIRHDKLSRVFLLLSLGLTAAHLVLIIYLELLFRKTNELVAIRYNIYFGVDRVGGRHELLFYPVLAALILILNTFLSLIVAKKSKLILYYVQAVTAAMLFLNLLTFIFVLIIDLEFIGR